MENYKMVISMKNIFVSMMTAVMLLVFIISGCGKSEEKNESGRAIVSDTVAVQVAKAEIKEVEVTKSFSGSLEGEEQANIVSKIPERIISIKVKVGDNVTAGQTLIELDKSGASSQFFQAQAGFLNSEKDLKRMQALYKEGAISQQMLDGIQTQYNVAKANFDAAKSTVELTTPISGVVTALNTNIGDLATPGIPLITIANINKMKVIFNAGETDITNFAVGQSAQIYSELKPALIQNGKISQIAKSADIQSRSFEIKALFNNTGDKWFKPGMFCTVNISVRSKRGSAVISNDAVINEASRKGVYVIENGTAFFKTVELGITNGIVTEVIKGLSGGEVVVILGANNLKDGSKVHITNTKN